MIQGWIHLPSTPSRQEDLLSTLEQSQPEHVHKQQYTCHDCKYQRFIHKLQCCQHHNDCKHNTKKHEDGTGGQSWTGCTRFITPHGCTLVGLDSLGKDEEHHGPHEDYHNNKEENVRLGPLIDTEGVELQALPLTVATVIVDTLAHVPGAVYIGIVVVIGIIGVIINFFLLSSSSVLKSTPDGIQSLLEFGFHLLRKKKEKRVLESVNEINEYTST